ncbi:hypothetical protein [uncultured Sphingorhabdus sp.]|uniref:hypothetical protein n=1 Tax=uncultured Sphingorhabdus sp. TaxID=1686106 RepID=UPI00262FFA0C|nr:hypothetical protein [uncultured Sphingorhabdus sp.]HMS20025.1 hypothetical protein [Sphingorhabdus sp.]
MTLSKTDIFSALVDQLGGPATVASVHGVNRRTLNRMLNGSQPPPNRLLDELQAALDAQRESAA